MTINNISIGNPSELARLIGNVAEEKRGLIDKSLNDKMERYNPILIGGDIFTVAYLAFQVAMMYAPSLAANAAVSISGFVLGEVAGVVTLLGGVLALKEALHAFHNGNSALGTRLLLDFFSSTGIGIVMMLISSATKIAAFAAVGAFFAANPWFLPALFFLAAMPILIETSKSIYNHSTGQDIASQLKLDVLEKNIENNNFELPEYFQIESKELDNLNLPYSSDEARVARIEITDLLTKRIEKLQTDMGAKAAVEAFRTWKSMVEKDQTSSQDNVKTLKNRVRTWNKAQKIRLAQQLILVAGVGLSLVATFPPGGNEKLAKIMDTANDGALAVGSGIMPACMDVQWPFKRNTPMIIPMLA